MSKLFAATVAAFTLLAIFSLDAKAQSGDDKANEKTKTVEGKVVDAMGQPVAGVAVRIFVGMNPAGTTTSNADGHYSFAVPLNPGSLTIVADDAAGDRQGFGQVGARTGAGPIAVNAIQLKQLRSTIVKVVDAKGAPVAGATVTTPGSKYLLGDLLLTSTTDARGLVTLHYSDDAFIYQIVAFKSGVGFDYIVSPLKFPGSSPIPSYSRDAQLGEPLPGAVILKLTGARTVRIKSVDFGGQALPDQKFSLVSVTLGGRSSSVALLSTSVFERTTDAEGVATFDCLPQDFVGEMQFGFQSSREKSVRTLEFYEALAIRASHPVEEITVPLLQQVKILGHVYDPEGKPATRIAVQIQKDGLRSGQAMTDVSGAYQFTVTEGKRFTAGVIDNHWTAPNQEVAATKPETSNIDFKLTAGTIVRGTVTEGPEHKPLANQAVEIVSDVAPASQDGTAIRERSSVYDPKSFCRNTTTDLKGQFQFCVPPGNYALSLGALEWIFTASHRFDLEVAGQREVVKDFELLLIETAMLSGQVLDAEGQPMAGLTVTGECIQQLDHGHGFFRTLSNEDGTFSASRPLAPMLVFAANRQQPKLVGAAILASDQKNVAIRVYPFVAAHGRLLDQQGRPFVEGRIEYGIKVQSNFDARIMGEGIPPAGDGTYTLPEVIPGLEFAVYWHEKRGSKPIQLTTFTAEPGKDCELGDTPLPKAEKK